ncbi:MAG: S-adenosylmethionine decarboxylase proenzyme [Alphaproteobacteria bacterium MarineAlpha11_Bin1]|nr:MAG: S-adenosylmethionine decarboxylase proenzyme [Alphaproteobacteria bacterium MarineAlpha11_Bin1]
MEKPAALTDVTSSIEFGDDVPPEATLPTRDFLIRRGGKIYAGVHLLIDFWGAINLGDISFVENTLRDAAEAANATVLYIHVHEFGGSGGLSGVTILAESHITIHTWPELDYAAFDVFMCGKCRPENALYLLEERFKPSKKTVTKSRRGLVG